MAGLCPNPLGELKRSPRPLTCNQGGPTSKGREGSEREGIERVKGEERGKVRDVAPNVESWIRQCMDVYFCHSGSLYDLFYFASAVVTVVFSHLSAS